MDISWNMRASHFWVWKLLNCVFESPDYKCSFVQVCIFQSDIRKQGCRIESVPLKRLLKLSNYRKKHWVFEQVDDKCGWLILEAF